MTTALDGTAVPLVASVGKATVGTAFAQPDETRCSNLSVDGHIDGPLTGTLETSYYYLGQYGIGLTSTMQTKEQWPRGSRRPDAPAAIPTPLSP